METKQRLDSLSGDALSPLTKFIPSIMHAENLSMQSLARSGRGGVGVTDLREALEGRSSMSNPNLTAAAASARVPSISTLDHGSASGGPSHADTQYGFSKLTPVRSRGQSRMKPRPGEVKDVLNKLGIGRQNGNGNAILKSSFPAIQRTTSRYVASLRNHALLGAHLLTWWCVIGIRRRLRRLIRQLRFNDILSAHSLGQHVAHPNTAFTIQNHIVLTRLDLGLCVDVDSIWVSVSGCDPKLPSWVGRVVHKLLCPTIPLPCYQSASYSRHPAYPSDIDHDHSQYKKQTIYLRPCVEATLLRDSSSRSRQYASSLCALG